MSNRRDVIKGGLALSSAPMLLGSKLPALAAGTPKYAGPKVSKVICDLLIPESRTFAREARRYRLPVHEISGDITELWYDDLYHLWRREPTAIAGLTASRTLFCLERLAWSAGLSVRFRIDQDAPARPAVAPNAWAVQMAQLIAGYAARGAITQMHRPASGFVRSTSDPTESLTAWIIAPASRG